METPRESASGPKGLYANARGRAARVTRLCKRFDRVSFVIDPGTVSRIDSLMFWICEQVVIARCGPFLGTDL